MLQPVTIGERPLRALLPALGPERYETCEETLRTARRALAGRTVWQVNTTAAGGGVAELSHALLPYARAAGVDVRWLVLPGDPAFFDTTKRLFLLLYGHESTPEPDDAAFAHYVSGCADAARGLASRLRPGDIVVLHDPQTAALAPALAAAGARVVWRCHIGCDAPPPSAERAWRRLAPFLDAARLMVFSTPRHVPGLWRDRRTAVRVIPPSLDPLSAKNREWGHEPALAILSAAGLFAPGYRAAAPPPGTAVARVNHVTDGPGLPVGRPLVTQVSRWDVLKDMPGVMAAFAERTADLDGAHLVLAGPDVTGVADDPGGAAVLRECRQGWRKLSAKARSRIHLVTVDMADPTANATVIAALQRHATVVTQKSLAEGFGLTVTEAMWKARPVVASAVGGITDQIQHGREGILVRDPYDHEAFGDCILRLLADCELRGRLGRAAHERVHRDYLPDRHLIRWAEALLGLLD
ncbi:glycosyltransferase [Streptomyces gamaensis]|uniref:Glycosyltransferase n=1 Tax=Streptomyces gamaensis TaxID=1763542 RepID=A0ABW0YY85_9ACTN